MLVGLVTNAVSESQWPGWLGWLQRHGWFSFALLGGAMVGLAVLLAALSESGAPERRAAPTPQPEEGAVPPGAALVLRSLPRDTTAFTDRSAELEALVRSVRNSQESGEALPVHVIDGMPGVGKTTFAVHAGHVLSERFPDGQLFVNLNGHTTGRPPYRPRKRSHRCWRRPECRRSGSLSATTWVRSPRRGRPCGGASSRTRRHCSSSTTRPAIASWSPCSPAGATVSCW